MKIYNEDFSKILNEQDIDFSKGYLKNVEYTYFIEEQKEVKEIGHYIIVAEYPNGGKDIEWVIDKPGSPYIAAHYETEQVQQYILYSQQELDEINRSRWEREKEQKINYYKEKLKQTDYQTLKFIEGRITQEEFDFWKNIRESFRREIRKLETFDYKADYEKLKEYQFLNNLY